ncbi:tellurium resistance protein TehB [Helicobacter sp. 13S00477-4]|uniref:class I SAM-dependent methyltransferase n=1 Tax=Helicobacter sp. 13S00477-4 TaxID=1905759 RepID=UPI0015DAEE6B|nr:tellurium resistance protein TehB [Helicobacter sp. 13S00477-4]
MKWDKKYSQDLMPHTPSNFLLEMVDFLSQGRVLDIAGGNGRHSKFLAQKGFECECVDISKVALAPLIGLKGLKPICVDLDDYKINADYYEAILDFYFLDRRLFSGIKKGLKVGGVFLMETFLADNDCIGLDSQKILNNGELEKIFYDFEIFFKEERLKKHLGREVKIIVFGARKI